MTCIDCGAPLAACLERTGSLRCHDCADAVLCADGLRGLSEGAGFQIGADCADKSPRALLAPSESSRILTSTGRYIDPLNLQPEDISIEDIAHHLSNQCRFSGAVRTYYSVAQHSVHASDLVDCCGVCWQRPEPCYAAGERLHALLHDAAEAYLVDLPRPVKHSEAMYAYRVAEWWAMCAIRERFGLPHETPIAVDHADQVMVVTERRDLLPATEHANGCWPDVEPRAAPIVPWSPGRAEEEFLQRFNALYREEN